MISFEDNYRRDSFSDRVCDDLSEVILQYLSLEDKFRLECVSKQFQRTILSLHRVLFIDFNLRQNYEFEKFEYYLKKLPNTKKVTWTKSHFHRSNQYHRFIELIVKYCKNLTHFDTFLGQVDDEDRRKVLKKFGSKLVSLDFGFSPFPGIFFNLIKVTKLEKLVLKSFDSNISRIQFSRLKSFEANYVCNNHLAHFHKFVERNRKTIRYLTLDCIHLKDKEEVKHLFEIITRLTNLVHLSLKHSKYGLNDKTFKTPLRQIALNCKQLKSIECRYLVELKNSTTNAELFSSLMQFKRLKRLKVHLFDDYVSEEEVIKNIKLFSFEAFKGFEELTHLTINSQILLESMDEKILTDIDINLPKLQYFSINFRLNASQWTVDILSRLSALQAIEIYTNLTEEARIHTTSKLIANCKRIKTIDLN